MREVEMKGSHVEGDGGRRSSPRGAIDGDHQDVEPRESLSAPPFRPHQVAAPLVIEGQRRQPSGGSFGLRVVSNRGKSDGSAILFRWMTWRRGRGATQRHPPPDHSLGRLA